MFNELNAPMPPEEMRAARAAFGLTLAGMASMLGLTGKCSKDTVRAWESGKNPVSGPAAIAVRLLLKRHEASRRRRAPSDPVGLE